MAYKKFVFDIHGVLLYAKLRDRFRYYLEQVALQDKRVWLNWDGDLTTLFKGLLFKNCPLCSFKQCTVAKIDQRPHLFTELYTDKVSYLDGKVLLTQLLTHHVNCDPNVRIILDYYVTFITTPELFLKDMRIHEEGAQLLRYVAHTFGRENVYLFSNASKVTLESYKQQYPEIFDVIPEENSIVSGITGYCKPSPEAFSALITLLGDDVCSTVLIDDLSANIQAARLLGIQTVLFNYATSQEQREFYTQIGFVPAQD